MEKKSTASYHIISDTNGNRYRFYCELSGAAIYTTTPIHAQDPDEELKLAWKEGRPHFNQCHKCGKWVCDVMFNADVLECVDCAPWEDQPQYCSNCGIKINAPDTYCRNCGFRLRYGKIWK